MSPMTTSLDQCSDEDLMNRLFELYDHADEDLMNRLFELYDHADEHADELAALDAAIHARLAATYTPDPGVAPRRRLAA